MQLETHNRKSTTRDVNTSIPNKVLQNDGYMKVTMHKHCRHPDGQILGFHPE
jgi:hypothetical protein